MAALPYIRFFSADYLADTQHLTTEQHGAYFLLILNYYQTGKTLDNSDDRLAVVAHLSNKRWQSVKSALSPFFEISVDNQWRHGRIEFELQKVLEKSRKTSYAGKESARRRRNEELERLAQIEREKAEKEATNVPTDVPTDVQQKGQQNVNHTEAEAEAEAEALKRIVQTSFERFWEIYPRRDGKKKALEAFEKALKTTTIETILEGVTRYIEFLKTTTQQTAMPATWLNGERWNDEVLALANSGPTVQLPHAKITDPISKEDYCQNCGSAWPCLTESKKGGNPF